MNDTTKLTDKERRTLLWLVLGSICLRWLVAMRTPVASEDGVTYLWMAKCFAAGDFRTPFGEVFPPLFPLLIAPLIALGLDATLAGQLVGCVCGGLAVLPIALLAQTLCAGAAVPAAFFAASLSLAIHNSAEIYTEPLFVLCAATAALYGIRSQPWRLGVFAALAALTRSEGAGLVLPFLLGLGFVHLRALLPTVVALLLFATARWLAGHGFDPIPKLGFHGARDDLPGRGELWTNLKLVPGAYIEAFLVAGVLLPLGALPPADRRKRPLWWCLLLGLGATLTFVVRKRFFLNWSFAVLPLAAAGLTQLRWMHKLVREVVVGIVCAVGLVGAFRSVMTPDRGAERIVGEHLARVLAPGERVDGDMPRVTFYAGCQPPPPRHWSVEALVERAKQPGVRFVALSGKSLRGAATPVQQALAAEFVVYTPPRAIADAAMERGIVLLVHR